MREFSLGTISISLERACYAGVRDAGVNVLCPAFAHEACGCVRDRVHRPRRVIIWSNPCAGPGFLPISVVKVDGYSRASSRFFDPS